MKFAKFVNIGSVAGMYEIIKIVEACMKVLTQLLLAIYEN